MTKSKMATYAKGWKPLEQRKAEKRNTPDSKGPGPNAWKKGLGKKKC